MILYRNSTIRYINFGQKSHFEMTPGPEQIRRNVKAIISSGFQPLAFARHKI